MKQPEVTYYQYEPVSPAFPPLKEGDRLRVIQQTPDGPIERIYIAGPPVYDDDALEIKQRFWLPAPPYEVIQ